MEKIITIREGNFVYHEGAYYKVVLPTTSTNIGFVFRQIETMPINLTTEWMEWFGFYEHYKSTHSQWSLHGVVIDQISDEDDDGRVLDVIPDVFFFDGRHIEYVHELQNLFFDITGKSLTLVDDAGVKNLIYNL